jgi:1-acyl-sn-glycerol-3-phosphate acyltransferase
MVELAQTLRMLHRLVRSVGRSLLFVTMLVMAVMDCWIRRPKVGGEGAVWIHTWCKRIAWALGFSCRAEGELPTGGAVVSNHLSYLDILLYSAVQPFVMVAKTEVRGWPLLGWLTMRAGTVYVTRGGGPVTYPGVNAAMAEAYRSGLPVLFFPEGTTTDGASVQPFRRGLFHSVLNNGVALRTAALKYSLDEHGVNGNATIADDVCWWGDMTFGPHIFRFLGLKGLRAEIRFGDEVRERGDRFVLSETAQERVAEMYRELEGTVASTERACEGELVKVS